MGTLEGGEISQINWTNDIFGMKEVLKLNLEGEATNLIWPIKSSKNEEVLDLIGEDYRIRSNWPIESLEWKIISLNDQRILGAQLEQANQVSRGKDKFLRSSRIRLDNQLK